MRGSKKAISIVAILTLALAGYLFYKNNPFSTVAKEKRTILEKAARAQATPLSEQEKFKIFEMIRGPKINEYHFSDAERTLLLKSLNR